MADDRLHIDCTNRPPGPITRYLLSKGLEGLHQLTDEMIDEVLDIACETNTSINTMLPFTPRNIQIFWKLFRCQQCGQCCLGTLFGNDPEQGVLLRTEEVRRLAHLSGLPRQRFLDIKTFSLKGKRLLSFPCHFYDRQSKSCRIYKYRPAACGQFPINTPMAFVGTGIPLEGVLMLLANPRCPGAKPVMKLLLQAIPRMYNREAKLPPETQQLLTEARLLRLSNIREEQTHMTIESVEGLRGQER